MIAASSLSQESPGSSNVTSGYSSDVDEGEERKERSNAKLGELGASCMPKRLESSYSVHKNVLSLHIDAGGACSVLAILRPKAIKRDLVSGDTRARSIPLEGRVLIYETKNVDMVKTIPWRAIVCATHEDYVKLALSEPHMADAPRDDVRDLLVAQVQDVSGSSPLTGDKEGAITPPNSPIASSPLDYLTLARLEAGRNTSPVASPLRAHDGGAMDTAQVRPLQHTHAKRGVSYIPNICFHSCTGVGDQPHVDQFWCGEAGQKRFVQVHRSQLDGGGRALRHLRS